MYIKLIKVMCFMTVVNCSEILRPRGVSISKISLYNPEIDFACFDGSLTIPFKYVNDDFCDCKDGSDEPGTSACPNGLFHCINAGHQALNIPSSRVNDGICDCCDASDEYASSGNCTDVCDILGEEARQQAQKQAELIKQGNELRSHNILRGKQLKQEKRDRIQALERDKIEALAVKEEKELLKNSAEEEEAAALKTYQEVEDAEKAEQAEKEKREQEQEAFEYFQLIDSNQDGKIVAAEIRVRQTFDQNKDGVVSDEEVEFFFGPAESMDLNEFFSVAYPRIKPFIMMEKGLFQPPTTEPEVDTNVEQEEVLQESEPTEEGQQEEWDEGEEDEEGKADDDVVEAHKDSEVGEEPKTKYSPEVQAIVDNADKARSEFEKAERSLRDIERELRHLQEGLEKDFGPEDEFASLDGECYQFTDREYTYKLCPFDQVSQQPRSGGMETRLGVWNNWVGGDNKYSAMFYDKGQSCWNGPQRSTHVEVSCGLENAVISASEPNRCEYLLHFTTPSACRLEEPVEVSPHDEL